MVSVGDGGAENILRMEGEVITRSRLINGIITRRGYTKYLEIGIRNPDKNFARIKALHKTGVDPTCETKGGVLGITSDQFFNAYPEKKFDIIFVDGDHRWPQVLRDVENSLRALRRGGTIIMHDCNPKKEVHQADNPVISHWNGTAWKVFAWYRMTRGDLEMYCVESCCCGVIRKGFQNLFTPKTDIKDMDWRFLVKHRKSLLNFRSASFVKMTEFK